MRYLNRSRSKNRAFSFCFATNFFWCIFAVFQIPCIALANESKRQNVDTFSTGQVTALLFSENSTVVLVLHNRDVRDRDELRCIVRLESGMRRVARGDSLLLKPTNQSNKYKFVVGRLAAGSTKRFEFPVSVAELDRKNATFSIKFGGDWQSTGIGVATRSVDLIPPIDKQWGTLTGRVVLDRDPPKMRRIPIRSGREFFGNHTFDESLVVNDLNQGISNVVVRLLLDRNEKKLNTHPGFKNPLPAILQIANGQFVPRISLLRSKQKLTILNRDDVAHNPNIDSLKNGPLNPLLKSNGVFQCSFGRPEPLPIPISGSIHSWLIGKIVVVDHPYVAKTDRNGRFEIRNLPPGQHTFQIWHERCGYVSDVAFDGFRKVLPKGILQFEIEKGTNDVGKLVASLDQFEK